jgi:hypothetical protein
LNDGVAKEFWNSSIIFLKKEAENIV